MKLKLEKIAKNFKSPRREVRAVRQVSLEVGSGEFFVLLGPSGCGKSTLLNLVAGLERPDGGRILFNDRVVACPEERIMVPPRKRNVAMVFQSYALYPHLTVFENIAFPLKVGGLSRAEIPSAVREAARSVRIENLLTVKPAELSGGQRQRVAIARAIVRRPAVLLLDEPLSNLDAALRASTRAELKRLQTELGLTTLYVTHDQVEAMGLGDRIGVMNQGRLEQIGSAGDLYRRPANTFVASFIGSPPMNLIPAARPNGLSARLIKLWTGAFGRRPPWPDEEPGSNRMIGLRPEDLVLVPQGDRTGLSDVLTGRLTALEPQGRESLVWVDIQGVELAFLTREEGLAEGGEVSLDIDPARLHFLTGRSGPDPAQVQP